MAQTFEQELYEAVGRAFPGLTVRTMSRLLGKSSGYWSSVTSQNLLGRAGQCRQSLHLTASGLEGPKWGVVVLMLPPVCSGTKRIGVCRSPRNHQRPCPSPRRQCRRPASDVGDGGHAGRWRR